jgi:serine/threonine protein kinase
VKVLDFGIAKIADASEQALTRGETLVGTPKYLSPEVALGKPADARSDIYSLGALMYFLLTGQAPFEGEAGAALLAHALYAPVAPSERREEPLHPQLEALILRCLAKDPEQRFEDAGALQRELVRILPEIQEKALGRG